MFGDNVELKKELAKQHVHDRLIASEKVASVVAFLFTDAASAINGTTVAVDDGFLVFKSR
jgi:enoyl-[acyl-carrier-protein] reductase (NADH)